MPDNEWINNVPGFDSLDVACTATAQAEIDNASLYDTLLASSNRRDLTNVFSNLQAASLNMHLPAFQACGGTVMLAGEL